MKHFTLPCGSVATVDDGDFHLLISGAWHSRRDGRNTYVVGLNNQTLHRAIMDPASGLVVDHINGDGLDNRRVNLRVCTQAENSKNRQTNAGKRFKGVSWCNRLNKFRACIGVNYRVIELGRFDSEIEAAVAYDKASAQHHGAFGRRNFSSARNWLLPYASADASGRI